MLPPHLAAEAAADLGATLVEARDYEAHRIALGAPRGGLDFQYNDAFPHEADMDQLNGIDFDKGCYVGQEVVSRVEHRGTARKRVVPVTFEDFGPEAGVPVKVGEIEVGVMGSSAQRPRPCDAASRPRRRRAGGRARRSCPAASRSIRSSPPGRGSTGRAKRRRRSSTPMSPLLHPDGKHRCPWPGQDPFYVAYHDDEWGVPEHDDRALYEKLVLDGFQAGLSWITILRKRENFRRAFDGFRAGKNRALHAEERSSG